MAPPLLARLATEFSSVDAMKTRIRLLQALSSHLAWSVNGPRVTTSFVASPFVNLTGPKRVTVPAARNSPAPLPPSFP
jgi:hypothetical protein